MDCYYKSVGRGAVLLLNQTPDTTGLIPEADARQAAEFGAEVQRRFGKSLAETSGAGPELLLDLGPPTLVDHAVIMEDIREGERIREYVVEGLFGTEWKTLAQGTAVGHKKTDRFAEPAKISALRLRCTASEGVPILRKLAAYLAVTSH
jgi:alpha-L-fucosidase